MVGGEERGRKQLLFDFNKCLVLSQGDVVYKLWYVIDEVSKKNINLKFIFSENRVKCFIECGSRGSSERGEHGPFSFKK